MNAAHVAWRMEKIAAGTYPASVHHITTRGNIMDYVAYKNYMFKYGFVFAPLNREQFEHCLANKVDWYGASCDVNAGIEFATACKINPVVEETYE